MVPVSEPVACVHPLPVVLPQVTQVDRVVVWPEGLVRHAQLLHVVDVLPDAWREREKMKKKT